MSEPAAPPALADSDEISLGELRLAARNHGMPLEALRYPVTPLGLHYLLVHYDIPIVDPSTWRLAVDGRVGRELSLTLEDVLARPAVTAPVTMECAGNGRALLSPRPISQPWLVEAVSTAEWTGTPLRGVLEEAGLLDDVIEILFTGLDRGVEGEIEQLYQRSLPVEEALRDEVLLVWGVNGQALPPQHGYPLRLLVPGWYGMTNVKWLAGITALAEPFTGYQQAIGYRLYRSEDDEAAEPVSRIMPRSLMVPPGIPDFLTRRRFVDAGRCLLEGRAWSGWGEIERVEVSVDGGSTWNDAALGEPAPPFAWRGWSCVWEAWEAGEYVLCSRATDAAGNTQSEEPPWNLKGFANNAVQRLPVTVRHRNS